jgi:DNA (cytosine-5)-methyltransferase 1
MTLGSGDFRPVIRSDSSCLSRDNACSLLALTGGVAGPATGPFHWTNRRLSSQELCRLQTFPDGLQFDCGRNDVQRMLGNAVPSLVAEVIAREIRGQLLEQPMKKKRLQLLPPRREPVPRRERVAKVPAGYYSLVGDHAEHPGEGLGNRARQRVAA